MPYSLSEIASRVASMAAGTISPDDLRLILRHADDPFSADPHIAHASIHIDQAISDFHHHQSRDLLISEIAAILQTATSLIP